MLKLLTGAWQILLHLLFLQPTAHSVTLDLNWISTNPAFENAPRSWQKEVRINDRIRFLCSTDGKEFSSIHRVDEKSALLCRLPGSFKNTVVGTCTKANDSVILRLRETPMLPNELSYKPDQNYFFISTSTGTADGLENSEGGLCRSHNMRLKLHVKPRAPTVFKNQNQEKGAIPSHMVVFPAGSREYSIPIMYVPVERTALDKAEKPRTIQDFPYNADGHFPVLSVPLNPFVVHTSRSGAVQRQKDDHFNNFDAGDQPSAVPNEQFLEARGGQVASFAESEALKNVNDRDFEIEYVDTNNAGPTAFSNDWLILIISVAFLVYSSTADNLIFEGFISKRRQSAKYGHQISMPNENF